MEMIYRSIEDLPIWNWNMIREKSDLTYLRVNRINGKVKKGEYQRLKKAWEEIFSGYIDHFGFSEEFLALHNKKKEIALLKAHKIISGDLSYNTIIQIAQKELSGMENAQKGGDFWQLKTSIEKALGFQIDVKKTTVVEFYTYLKDLSKKKFA